MSVIFGRTNQNKIQIKNNASGAPRVVNCACCGVDFFYPCEDCIPVLQDWTFNLSGNLVRGFTEENDYPASVCPSGNCIYTNFPSNLPPRTCMDSWEARKSYNPETGEYAEYYIEIIRSSLDNTAQTCGWNVRLWLVGNFYISEIGDMCSVFYDDYVFTSAINPVGSYYFTIYAACFPPCDPSMPPGFPCGDPINLGLHTVTIT